MATTSTNTPSVEMVSSIPATQTQEKDESIFEATLEKFDQSMDAPHIDDAVDDVDSETSAKKYRWYSPRWHLLDNERFVTSYFVSPAALLGYRLFVTIYMTTVIVGEGLKSGFDQGESFKFFTWMSFFSLYAYFLFATIHTAAKVITGRPALMEFQHRYLNRIFWLLYELEVTYHIIVPAIYWVLLAADAPNPTEDPIGFWINISVHGFEAVFIVIDVALNRNLMLTSHVIFMFVAAWLYCAYAWIWYAFGYALPYEFLGIWWYYFALPVVFIIIYFIMFYIHAGKEKAFGKRYARKQALLDESRQSTVNLV